MKRERINLRQWGLCGLASLLMLLGIFTGFGQVYAVSTADAKEPIDTAKAVTLTVHYTKDGTQVPGVPIKLYKVATVAADGTMTAVEEYAKYPVSFAQETQSDWQGTANALAGYAAKDALAPAASGTTDAQGAWSPEGLTQGLYLGVCETTKYNGYTYTAEPFLTLVPGLEESSGQWVYDVDVHVKPDRTKDETPPTPVEPEDKTVTITAIKEWEGFEGHEAAKPEAIQVQLLCDGAVVEGESKTLSSANNWKGSWTGLSDAHEWSVVEVVPERTDAVAPANYTVSVSQDKSSVTTTFVVKNTYKEPPKEPGKRTFTVKKVWSDSDNADKARPQSILVQLYRTETKDGVATTKPYGDMVVLNADNQWIKTWTDLEDTEGITWTVQEFSADGAKEIPSYNLDKIDYLANGEGATITNSYVPPTPDTDKLTVKKVWSDDNDKQKKRPASVEVQLYKTYTKDGKTVTEAAGDKVTLDEKNQWTYTWTALEKSADVKWSVDEVSVPDGYKRTVVSKDGVYTITNTYEPVTPQTPQTPNNPKTPSNPSNPSKPSKLPQTGQLWWPVPVLAALGLLFVGIGVSRRRDAAAAEEVLAADDAAEKR